MEEAIRSLFAKVDRDSFFRELAPELTVGDGTLTADRLPPLDPMAVDRAKRDLEVHGYFRLDGLVPPSRVAPIAGAIVSLVQSGVPASFVFAYDEVWSMVMGVRRALTAVIGDDYGIVPDIWAWLVPRARRGWKAHRGTYEDNRREGGPPRMINVWIALSEVTADSACMHVVPLERDPHVPLDLKSLEYDERAALPLPARPGTVLAWSSNVIHWGGEMSPLGTSPRISLSATLRAPAEADDFHESSVLPFRERLDLLAEMIAIYGHHDEGEDGEPARQWSQMTLAMKQLGRRT